MHKLILGLALVSLISAASFSERAIAGNATPYLGTEVIATKYSFGQLRTRLEAAIEKSGIYVITRPAPAPARNTGASKFPAICYWASTATTSPSACCK